jgi:hypothetical protein
LNLKRIKPNVFHVQKKSKIVIIGDSHGTGCATEVSNYLGKTFEVTGTVTPEARCEDITLLLIKI